MLGALELLVLAEALIGSQLHLSKMRAPPDCRDQVFVGFDGEDGNFNGMSHSGVLLIIRNLGPTACRTPALPTLRMLDVSGRTLPFAPETPPATHLRRVVRAVEIAPGGQATSALRWVSGPVFDRNRCITPARITVRIVAGVATLRWPGGQVCGAVGKPVRFSQPVLRTDPVRSRRWNR